MSIYKKLSEFQKEVQIVPFDSENKHFKNKYASLASVIKTVSPILHKVGLCHYQIVTESGLITIVVDTETGDKIESITRLPVAETSGAQQVGAALTYMRRYALCAILGIVGDEDDDGNAAQTAKPEPKKEPGLSEKIAAIPAVVANTKTPEKLNENWVKVAGLPLSLEQRKGIFAIFNTKAAELGVKWNESAGNFL